MGKWCISVILVFATLGNLFIIDEDLVRTRLRGGYRKEYGT